MRIVCVDDDADILMLASAMLSFKHDVQTFNSVAAAQAGDWHRVDAAFIDVMMPGTSGDVLVEWLAQNHPHVRRVVVTAMPVQELSLAPFGLAHEIVQKPFGLNDLEDALG